MHAAEILLQHGLLNQRQLDQARQHNGGSVLDSAIALRFVNEDDALRAIGKAIGLEYVDLSSMDNEGEMKQLLQDFPQKLIHRQSLFPIRRYNGSLVVATSDPFNLYPLDELSAATGLSRDAGAGQPAGDRQADQDASRRRQRDDRGADGPDGRRRRRRAARGRSRPTAPNCREMAQEASVVRW